ncbi:PTH1 family peptidyl-tRNA hydrolase [Rhizomicrobium palustre]|uniref:Peptidyl-tRNA hydrolase n=1 Tax=Rhizomicrobium palustre TaxID=189966 RepID=A0A846MWN4_9PROT|nr:aminoacyl-tRNA hydrolase [Rhizomicrobium palustre]NIK87753.1 PTH1 family peptidyl-tRNA hydrolase [Rhizomicrobium palustre]
MADAPLLIAGLGNPGAQYAKNRHNVGFMALDRIHDAYGFSPWRAKFQGEMSEGKIAGRKTYLIKPQTYMNLSGDSVGAAARFLKLRPSSLVVLHDEIDLAAGKLKAKTGGGDAGHNGLRSITATLGSDYIRVRIGVGHPGGKSAVVGHVLANFSKADEEWLDPILAAISDCTTLLAQNDVIGFMNKVAATLHPQEHTSKPEKN